MEGIRFLIIIAAEDKTSGYNRSGSSMTNDP